MKKFVISFYVPDEHNKLVFLAKAVASGETDYEAAARASEALRPTHPTLKAGYWLASVHRGGQASEPL
jgi:hypothetical protein